MTQVDVKKVRNEKTGKKVCDTLNGRGFAAFYCSTKEEALDKALELIPEGSSITWGGCRSAEEIGLIDAVKKGNYQVMNYALAASAEERTAMMKQAFTCDVFLTGTNAITETGELVNIDGTGNRVAAMTYGPDSVIVIAGMNKLVPTVMDAVTRARNTAAPINVQRFDVQTPCKIDGMCHDCNTPDCICNYFVRTRRCRPDGRIKVILVGESLGF